MDEISLVLGITGTGGVVCGIIFYAITKGMHSKCRTMQTEISLDIHRVSETHDGDIMKQSVASLTRGELEEIIIHTIAKHNPPQSTGNIIIPNFHSQSKEFEDMIKSTILHTNDRGSPFTRSRSGSEDSHRSHKSHKSNKSGRISIKEENIVILSEEL